MKTTTKKGEVKPMVLDVKIGLEISIPAAKSRDYVYPNGHENRTYVIYQENAQWRASSTWESGHFKGGPYPDRETAIKAVLADADEVN